MEATGEVGFIQALTDSVTGITGSSIWDQIGLCVAPIIMIFSFIVGYRLIVYTKWIKSIEKSL